MGYDLERFIGYVNEGLLCCICQDVLENPLQAPCEHAFCASCIHEWLVHHSNCPEDRQPLNTSLLRPLYRYMRNDLNRLQLCCRNGKYGCEVVCPLESMDQHERECEYGWISRTATGCPVQVEQRHLNGRLAECKHRRRDCPKCGTLRSENKQSKCPAEPRTELGLFRSVMKNSLKEAKHEMESSLGSQRQKMAQKGNVLQNIFRKLKKRRMSQMKTTLQSLQEVERQISQELEQAELEKQVLMEFLRSLQEFKLTTADGNKKSANFHSLTRLEIMGKKKPRDVTII